jgi:hypothetical protein
LDEPQQDQESPQPTGQPTASYDGLLLSAAHYALHEGVSIMIVLPRAQGVVSRAREIARANGLSAWTQISAGTVSVQFARR